MLDIESKARKGAVMAAKTGPARVHVTRGQAFHNRVVAAFTLSEPESELLAEVRDVLDEIAGLKAAVDADGLTVKGASGQVRVHPAVAQLSQHRLALGRLLAQLGLPDEDGSALPSPISARARSAAKARWSKDPYRQVGA